MTWFRRTKKVDQAKDNINNNIQTTNDDTPQYTSGSLKRVIALSRNLKAEFVIVTYLTICATQDLNEVDRIVVYKLGVVDFS